MMMIITDSANKIFVLYIFIFVIYLQVSTTMIIADIANKIFALYIPIFVIYLQKQQTRTLVNGAFD